MTGDYSLLFLCGFIVVSVVAIIVIFMLLKTHKRRPEPRVVTETKETPIKLDMDLKSCDETKIGSCINYTKTDYMYDRVLKDDEKMDYAFDMLQYNVEAKKELAVSQIDWKSFTSREGIENKAVQVVKDIFINPDMKKHMLKWRFSMLMFGFVLILVLSGMWVVFVLFDYPRQQQEFALKAVFTMCILVGLIFLVEWVSFKVVENVEEVGKMIN
jgi:hypothetical protein